MHTDFCISKLPNALTVKNTRLFFLFFPAEILLLLLWKVWRSAQPYRGGPLANRKIKMLKKKECLNSSCYFRRKWATLQFQASSSVQRSKLVCSVTKCSKIGKAKEVFIRIWEKNSRTHTQKKSIVLLRKRNPCEHRKTYSRELKIIVQYKSSKTLFLLYYIINPEFLHNSKPNNWKK